MKNQVVHFQSRHESGNIYWILAEVRKIMRKGRRITEYNNMWEAVQKSGSYDEALKIISQHGIVLADKDTLQVYKDGKCTQYDPETGMPKDE